MRRVKPLVHEDRFLIEDRDIAYCHSLLAKESLSFRQMRPGARSVPSITRSALLLGDPNYRTSKLLSLPGTKIEVAQVAELLRTEKVEAGENVFEEVQVCTGVGIVNLTFNRKKIVTVRKSNHA